MLRYADEVYASKAISIADDIRVLRIPQKFRIPEAYIDFEMRLEVYDTTFSRDNGTVRETMLKKYGLATFGLADTGLQRKRYEMVEVIKSENNPLRKKILMTVSQKITANVFCEGVLMVKLGESWYKTQALLVGHLLEIVLADEEDVLRDPILLDLKNFDSDFIVPVNSRVSKKPFSFLLKFNEAFQGNDFQ